MFYFYFILHFFLLLWYPEMVFGRIFAIFYKNFEVSIFLLKISKFLIFFIENFEFLNEIQFVFFDDSRKISMKIKLGQKRVHPSMSVRHKMGSDTTRTHFTT